VRKPRNFGNPGAFDYARFLARQDIFWTASGADHTLRHLPGRCGSSLQKGRHGLRQAALDRIARLYHGDSYQTGMRQALLIGQNFQFQRVWTEVYRSTGTFSRNRYSSTRVAIRAAFFLFLLRVCFVPESLALLTRWWRDGSMPSLPDSSARCPLGSGLTFVMIAAISSAAGVR
jgi:predicted membrane metal-binding protein